MDVRVTNNFAQVRIDTLRSFGAMRQQLAVGLDAVGMQAIDYATSFTSKRSPPAGAHMVMRGPKGAKLQAMYIPPRKKGSRARRLSRPQHPGGWADDQVIAARSYGHSVSSLAGVLILEIRNTAEHAVYLELRGYGVISNLFEGYVQRAVAKMVRGVAA